MNYLSKPFQRFGFFFCILFAASCARAEYYIVYPEPGISYSAACTSSCYKVIKKVKRVYRHHRPHRHHRIYVRKHYPRSSCNVSVNYYYPYAVYPNPCAYDCTACSPCKKRVYRSACHGRYYYYENNEAYYSESDPAVLVQDTYDQDLRTDDDVYPDMN